MKFMWSAKGEWFVDKKLSKILHLEIKRSQSG